MSTRSWRDTFPNERLFALGKTLLPALVAVVAMAVFQSTSDGAFLTPRNLSNLARQICGNALLATGMTFVILTAGIDLSVGSVLALSSMVAALTQVRLGWGEMGLLGAFGSVLCALATGAASGALTGTLIARLRITPFIVTLAMMVIARGLVLVISNAQAVAPVGDTLGALSSGSLSPFASAVLLAALAATAVLATFRSARGSGATAVAACVRGAAVFAAIALAAYAFVGYRGIPFMVLLVAVCVAASAFVLSHTRFGRFLYAIGSNREAAELSGVPVARTLAVAYLAMGLLAALAGVVEVARVNGAVPSAGELAELDAIAAVVIGGTSLMGGSGSLFGTLLGVLIIGTLNNGMSLVGLSEHLQKIFKGLVILIAVYVDLRAKRRAGV